MRQLPLPWSHMRSAVMRGLSFAHAKAIILTQKSFCPSIATLSKSSVVPKGLFAEMKTKKEGELEDAFALIRGRGVLDFSQYLPGLGPAWYLEFLSTEGAE